MASAWLGLDVVLPSHVDIRVSEKAGLALGHPTPLPAGRQLPLRMTCEKVAGQALLCANCALRFFRPVRSSSYGTNDSVSPHCSFADSALACFKMGMSGSASFQSVRKSLYAFLAPSLSPLRALARP